jgi:hypothetical protein
VYTTTFDDDDVISPLLALAFWKLGHHNDMIGASARRPHLMMDVPSHTR